MLNYFKKNLYQVLLLKLSVSLTITSASRVLGIHDLDTKFMIKQRTNTNLFSARYISHGDRKMKSINSILGLDVYLN